MGEAPASHQGGEGSIRATGQAPASAPRPLACPSCGAPMQFDPPRMALACKACGHSRPLPQPSPQALAKAQEEQDYREALQRLADREPSLQARVVDCPACGAQTRFEGHVVGDRCSFCATPLLLEQARIERLIQAQALVPFTLDKAGAQAVFGRWVASRWFAPNALKKTISEADGIHGVYTPWWTYDAQTVTTYRGERGTHRQVAETGRDAQGQTVSTQRTVTDWRPVQGMVAVPFDDILVVGSPSVPAHLGRVLDRWQLKNLLPPSDEAMAGFTVEVYRTPLEAGYAQARERMAPTISQAIAQDIGGDAQRIHAQQTTVDDIRFKHLLLPVWIGSYRFGGKPYQVVVNGQTGEVEGDRPYSSWKIGLAALMALVLLLIFLNLQDVAR